MTAVEVENLGRIFGRGAQRVVALNDLSFSLDEGQVLGVLGANGAGKTTLTKILATLLEPSTGDAWVFGHHVRSELRAVRKEIGVVFGGDRGFYGALSAIDNLRYFSLLAGVEPRSLGRRVTQAIDEVGLRNAAHRRVETYSRGMKQRLHIALGMVSKPRLLLLDEPTVGLDPIEAERLRTTVAGLRNSGVTILLTSHYLLDIERLADRVLVIANGCASVNTTANEFAGLAGFTATVVVRGQGTPPATLLRLAHARDENKVLEEGDSWTLRVRIPEWGGDVFDSLGKVLENVRVISVEVEPVRLEDVYSLVMDGIVGLSEKPL